MFQPPKFDWHSEDQQTTFKEWKRHISLTLEASNFPQERWYASIIGFLGQEGFQQWQHMDISKDPKMKKVTENVFQAIANTLEVSMSYWNYINEMYSDIRQGEQETTNQLDQCIKVLVKNCGYTSEEEKKNANCSYSSMQQNTLRSGSGSDCRQHRTKHLTNYYYTPNSMRQPSRTSINTSTMEELQQQPP